MNKLVTAQTLLFMTSVEIGILMGIVFDLIRIFRKIIKHPNFFVQLEDMFFWVFCAFMSFYMLYICNYAAIRPFIFIGIICGAIFYFLTFSVWFMKLATIVINYVKALIKQIIYYVMIPIKWLMKVFIWPIRSITKKIRKLRWQMKVKRHKWLRVKYEQKMDKKVEHYLKNGKT